MTANQDRAVQQIAALRAGETYSKARMIPGSGVTPERIRQYKRELLQTLTSAIRRARQQSFAEYTMRTVHSFTEDYDVAVVGLVTMRVDNDRRGDEATGSGEA